MAEKRRPNWFLKPWRLFVVVWGTVLILAFAVSRIWRVNFWMVFGITAAALVINGIVAEVEDRLPGGFLNPRTKDKNSQEK